MAKLPKGLYQRGSIFWTKVYQHGRPIYQSTSTSNLTEAKRILDVRRGAAQRGESVLPRVDRVRWEEAQVSAVALVARATVPAVADMLIVPMA